MCSAYRFLVPRDMSVGQFIHILNGRLHLAPGKALFVFVKETLPQTSKTIITHLFISRNILMEALMLSLSLSEFDGYSVQFIQG